MTSSGSSGVGFQLQLALERAAQGGVFEQAVETGLEGGHRGFFLKAFHAALCGTASSRMKAARW